MSYEFDESTAATKSSWNKPHAQQQTNEYQQPYQDNQRSNSRGNDDNKYYRDGADNRSYNRDASYGNQGKRINLHRGGGGGGGGGERSDRERQDKPFKRPNDRSYRRDDRSYRVEDASYGGNDRSSRGDERSYRGDRSYRGGRSYRGNDRSFRSDQGEKSYDSEEGQTIKVPTKFVGRIIGKGGSKISDLQFQSGAAIKVTKDTDGDYTKIIIIGGKEQTKKAEELIMDLTIERSY